MRIYLGGPMRGRHHFGFPAFDRAREWLRAEGHVVYCPAEHDRQNGFDETKNSLEGFDMEAALTWDVGAVLRADAIALLPGWAESSGASFEREIAQRCGKGIIYLHPLFAGGYKLRQEPIPPSLLLSESIAEEAHRLVHGDRQDDYGHPFDDFGRTAHIWTAILGQRITPEQVGLCMIGVKVSRHVNRPLRDNLVDCAGYAATLELVMERRALIDGGNK